MYQQTWWPTSVTPQKAEAAKCHLKMKVNKQKNFPGAHGVICVAGVLAQHEGGPGFHPKTANQSQTNDTRICLLGLDAWFQGMIKKWKTLKLPPRQSDRQEVQKYEDFTLVLSFASWFFFLIKHNQLKYKEFLAWARSWVVVQAPQTPDKDVFCLFIWLFVVFSLRNGVLYFMMAWNSLSNLG